METVDLRVGGMGVPQLFELSDKDRECLEEAARMQVWRDYNGDLDEWPERDQLLQDIEYAIERGGGMEAAEQIVNDYAAGKGLEPA